MAAAAGGRRGRAVVAADFLTVDFLTGALAAAALLADAALAGALFAGARFVAAFLAAFAGDAFFVAAFFVAAFFGAAFLTAAVLTAAFFGPVDVRLAVGVAAPAVAFAVTLRGRAVRPLRLPPARVNRSWSSAIPPPK